MNCVPAAVPDVLVLEPKVFSDDRGFFFESYREDLFAKLGVRERFVQDNHSRSRKGALRGLHYQAAPHAQAKLVRVVVGEVFDVAVDIRPGSKTFGQAVCQVLSAANKKMMYVPAGFAHGYLTLSDEAELLYKVSDYYSPQQERGLRWNDPSVKIAWPVLEKPYLLNERDKNFPGLESLR